MHVARKLAPMPRSSLRSAGGLCESIPKMRAAIAVLLVPLLPLVARAETDRRTDRVHEAANATPIIGGTNAPFGKWPDVAAVYITGSRSARAR